MLGLSIPSFGTRTPPQIVRYFRFKKRSKNARKPLGFFHENLKFIAYEESNQLRHQLKILISKILRHRHTFSSRKPIREDAKKSCSLWALLPYILIIPER
jgi:hypothetical protein